MHPCCNPALDSADLALARTRVLAPWQVVLAGSLREACGHLMVRWARWTRDDVLLVLGVRMQLVGLLQRACGVSRELVVPEVDAWLRRTLRLRFGEPSVG